MKAAWSCSYNNDPKTTTLELGHVSCLGESMPEELLGGPLAVTVEPLYETGSGPAWSGVLGSALRPLQHKAQDLPAARPRPRPPRRPARPRGPPTLARRRIARF